jgi:hypothetical protein
MKNRGILKCCALACAPAFTIWSAAALAASADQPQTPSATAADVSPQRHDEQTSSRPQLDQPGLYPDEPPLDYYQRQWRWYSRHAHPRHFASRDLRRQYGYEPPFGYGYFPYGFGYGYPYGGVYGYPYDYYGAGPYGGFGNAYIQGRYDERRFQQWRTHYESNKKVYINAMDEGVGLYREGEYAAALRDFILAAKLDNGDSASRLHAAYCLVAIGNYDDAVLMVRRALQLQSRLPYLALDIPAEYGVKVDFDAHLQRLEEAAKESPDDPGLWMLLGFYHYFSGRSAEAVEDLTKARQLAPADTIISDLLQAARLLTPSAEKHRKTAPRD